jgi:hypothetical protein
MVSMESPGGPAASNPWSQVDRLVSNEPDTLSHYRVVALPAVYALADDVIIGDERGRQYLLSHDSAALTPLDRREVDALGMFFEASQDSSWHTVPELRRIIYGASDSALT